MERKYRQRGYEDRNSQDKKRARTERPPSGEPRPKMQDAMGPRTPRMVGTVTRARCSSCGAVLMPGFDQSGECPRCHAALHSCKQCVHFDTAAQFECTEPIPERIAKKDVYSRPLGGQAFGIPIRYFAIRTSSRVVLRKRAREAQLPPTLATDTATSREEDRP